MANLNDGKIPVKNFNDFFENDQTSKAFSKLKLRKLKDDLPLLVNPTGPKTLPPMAKPSSSLIINCKYYKYSKEELLEISRCPLSRITKKEFLSRLKNPDLDEEIVSSFQRKERNNANNDETSDHSQNYVDNNNHHGSGSGGGGHRANKIGYNNNGQNSQENNNNPYNQKFHRFGKNFNEADTFQCWRNAADRYSPNFRGGKRDTGNFSRRNNNRYNSKYENGSREEPEPEWFSNGPKSMTDFIDLKGFDDDQNNNQDEIEDDSQEDSSENNKDDNQTSMLDISDITGAFESSTLDSFLDAKDFSDPLAMDQSIGSRAIKWFNRNKNSAEGEKRSAPSANTSKPNNTLAELFQISSVNQFSQPSHLELSKAVNVSELEADMLENKKQPSPVSNKPEPVLDISPEVVSKLQFLADNHRPNKAQSPPDQMDSLLMQMLSMKASPKRSTVSPHGQFPNEAPIQFFSPNENLPIDKAAMLQNIMAMNQQRAMMAMKQQKQRPSPPNMIPNSPRMNIGPQPPPQHLPPEMMANPMMQMNMGFPRPMMSPHLLAMGFPPRPAPPPPNTPLEQTIFVPHAASFNMIPPGPLPGMANFGFPGQPIAPPHFNLERRPNIPSSSQNDGGTPSMANKLLKDSKFTPTSVFRKLKDHEQSNKQQQQKPVTQKPENILDRPIPHDEVCPNSMDNELFKQLSFAGAGGEFIGSHPSSPATKPSPQSRSSTTPAAINPSELFNALKVTPAANPTATGLPVLPLQNAMRLEDIEKF